MSNGSYVEYLKNRHAQTNARSNSIHVATVETRYLRLPEDTHGWIDIIIESSGQRVSICEYTKVVMIKDEGDRTYFRILDGLVASGKTASMKSSAAREFLKRMPPTVSTETVTVTYGRIGEEDSPFKGHLRQQWATLKIGNQKVAVTLNSVWNGEFSPIPPGIHRIMAPDYSHANTSTEGYRNTISGQIKANDVWFPIELSGTKGGSSRYVHIGHLSEGCVTVHEIAQWNVVYDFLISHRLPGTEGRYVALLEVIV